MPLHLKVTDEGGVLLIVSVICCEYGCLSKLFDMVINHSVIASVL